MKKSSGTPGKSAGPLLIAVALLLCVPVYFVSYVALVVPNGVEVSLPAPAPPVWKINHYRLAPDQAAVVYWPLEQMDRRIRPAAWEASWIDIDGPGSISSFDGIICSFGAEEMTTEASFFEEPEETAEACDSNPFDDVP
jgi:hypothetical protein